ncbi:hypothetical protein PQX77_002351 [Marasmius sp. AFHP31]|nr:hypothetical protein PQX77_002351 [Marasmius sp. AFHP31]
MSRLKVLCLHQAQHAISSILRQFFIKGEKQNTSHTIAYCCGCIEARRPSDAAIELDDDGKPILAAQSWVVEAMSENIGRALGKKDLMVAHILGKSGKGGCLNASSDARKLARSVRMGGRMERGLERTILRHLEKT